MGKVVELLKKFWEAVKPDPYSQIAGLMQFEGYTDFEIALEIERLKRANGDT